MSNIWQGLPTSHLLPKLVSVFASMAKWGRSFFHKFREKVIKQKVVLDGLKNRHNDDGIYLYLFENTKMKKLLLHEEVYRKQRAKAFWLDERDTNSKFFHATASSRKKMNHISSLKIDDDHVVSDHRELCCLLNNYYSSIFAASRQATNYPFNENELRVPNDQNDMLVVKLSFEEFTEIVKSMHPDKASGPDELNPDVFCIFGN